MKPLKLVSLVGYATSPAQREAIQVYADSAGFPVVAWFDGGKLDEAKVYCRLRQGRVGLVAASMGCIEGTIYDLLELRDGPFPVIMADNPFMGSLTFGVLAVLDRKS